ncbi:MAG: RsmD family RNA methyltransferase, partial [Flavobacteriales bacterium]
MRVIGGSAKGRKFTVPKGFDSSPTTDYAKEGLFNILEHKLNMFDLRVLDLCCGTGSMSYEFASRGAEEVLALDKNPKCIKYVAQNAELFRLEQITARRMDVNS